MSASRLFWFVIVLLAWVVAPSSAQNTTRGVTTYATTNQNFANPERGFYHQDAPMWRGTQTTSQSVASLRALRDEGISTVRWYFLIDEFVTSNLSSSALDFIGAQFNNAREAGVKVIPRFAYNFPEGGTFPYQEPDASLAQIQAHLTQLTPILTTHSDVIAFMEIGFVGAWGEWHSSTSGHVTDGQITDSARAIVSALMAALPSDRMVAMRYAPYKQQLYGDAPLAPEQAFNGSPQARMGAHNDCFLASYTDWGTYPSDPEARKAVRQYLSRDNRFVPQGGETCNDNAEAQPYIGCTNALADLARLRFSSLNIDYKVEVLDGWRAGGCFNPIARRLGYRLSLVQSAIPSQAAAGEVMNLSLVVQNTGFASPYNPRGFEIVLRAHANGQLYRPALAETPDPRRWLPDLGAFTLNLSLTLPVDLPGGSYDVLLNLPDPEPTLYGRPEYSIRLANVGTWEADTGFNDLLVDVTVEGQTTGITSDLLTNGGFESGLTGWTVRRPPTTPADDKVVCAGATAQGVCSFRFRGRPGENTRLVQPAALDGVTLVPSDTLTVRLAYATRSASTNLRVRVIATPVGGAPVTAVLLTPPNFAATSAGADLIYDLRSADVPPTLYAAPLQSLVVQVHHRAQTGKLWVDDVRLLHTTGAPRTPPGVLPLP